MVVKLLEAGHSELNNLQWTIMALLEKTVMHSVCLAEQEQQQSNRLFGSEELPPRLLLSKM